MCIQFTATMISFIVAIWLAFQKLTVLNIRFLIITKTNALNQISNIREFVTNFVAQSLRHFLTKSSLTKFSI